jgi:hypothetical protein
MSLSQHDLDRLTAAIVRSLDQERHERLVRCLKWSISVLSLVISAMALALGLGLI